MGSCLCRCCGGKSNDDTQNSGEEGEPHREIRDIIWALLFIAFWAGSWTYSSLALKKGDPALLVYGLDYDGNVCNRNQARELRRKSPEPANTPVSCAADRSPWQRLSRSHAFFWPRRASLPHTAWPEPVGLRQPLLAQPQRSHLRERLRLLALRREQHLPRRLPAGEPPSRPARPLAPLHAASPRPKPPAAASARGSSSRGPSKTPLCFCGHASRSTCRTTPSPGCASTQRTAPEPTSTQSRWGRRRARPSLRCLLARAHLSLPLFLSVLDDPRRPPSLAAAGAEQRRVAEAAVQLLPAPERHSEEEQLPAQGAGGCRLGDPTLSGVRSARLWAPFTGSSRLARSCRGPATRSSR